MNFWVNVSIKHLVKNFYLEKGLPNQIFEAGGADGMSFNEIIDLIANGLRKKSRKMHLPKALFVMLAKWHPDFDPTLIGAIDEDEVADPNPLSEYTGIKPRRFADGLVDLL